MKRHDRVIITTLTGGSGQSEANGPLPAVGFYTGTIYFEIALDDGRVAYAKLDELEKEPKTAEQAAANSLVDSGDSKNG